MSAVFAEIQMRTNGRIGVITEPVLITDCDQEQVQGPSGTVGPAEQAGADELMIDPAKAGRHAAQMF